MSFLPLTVYHISMFTGLIEELGTVSSVSSKGQGKTIRIEAVKVLEDIKVGDSIAHNGICLTVASVGKNYYYVDVSTETLNVTSIKNLVQGTKINLERAMQAGSRFGGHIVTGHVDTVGRIEEKRSEGSFYVFYISFDKNYDRYVINKGSIAVDGISLTVNEKREGLVRLNIIPHTLKETNLQFLNIGSLVNIEFDIIGKYVENLLKYRKSPLDENYLRQAGFGGNLI